MNHSPPCKNSRKSTFTALSLTSDLEPALRSDALETEFWLHCLLIVKPWASYLIFLCLGFFFMPHRHPNNYHDRAMGKAGGLRVTAEPAMGPPSTPLPSGLCIHE